MNENEKLFEGKIDRLVIVAGFSGSGKSTFLKDPAKFLEQNVLPTELQDFFIIAKNHAGITQLADRPAHHIENLCLHVDLTNPIRSFPTKPNTREQLLRVLTKERFQSWRLLTEYTKRASTVDIVTFFVSRREHFQRFVYRKLKNKSNTSIFTHIAAILGDSQNNDELHRKIYEAWLGFTETISYRSHHIIDGHGESYRFISEEEFCSEIQGEYNN